MATWTTPLPDNGTSPIVEGAPGHPTMHNEIVDNITEIRDNVDAIAVDTLPDAGVFGKTLMKADSNGTAWLDLGVAAAVQTVVTADTLADARTALGATTTGAAVFTAANAAAAATAVGATATGASLITAASKAAAATAVSAGAVGSGVLNATTTAAAQTAVGINASNLLVGSVAATIADPTDATTTQAAVISILTALKARGVIAS